MVMQIKLIVVVVGSVVTVMEEVTARMCLHRLLRYVCCTEGIVEGRQFRFLLCNLLQTPRKLSDS